MGTIDQAERNAEAYDRRMGITEPGQTVTYPEYDPEMDNWHE